MYTKITFFTMIFMIFCVTHSAHADVIINEVAWMGTVTSANDEWIELYNTGTNDVNLDGWTLSATDGSPSIDLSGTISGGGYYLVERTDDSTVPGITAGVIYSGSLSNTGETLVIKDNLEAVIDTVAMSGGWTAGDSTSKQTMQKSSGAWITAQPTPGAVNNPGSTTSSGTGSSTGTTNTTNTTTTTTSTTTPQKQKTEQEYWQEYVKQLDPDPKYSARMIVPDQAVAHVPLKMSALVKKFDTITVIEGRYEWSMGDGQSYVFRQNTPIRYTYQQPGEYVVVMKYYSNAFKEEPDSIHQKTITVLPPNIETIVDIPTGNITLTNKSDGDIDLYQWKIRQFTGNNFQFSTSLIIKQGSSITVPATVHQLPYLSNRGMQLITPTGYVIPNTFLNSPSSNSSTPRVFSQISLIPSSQPINSVQEFSTEENPETLYQRPQSTHDIPSPRRQSSNRGILLGFITFITITTLGFHRISYIKNDEKITT